MGELGTVEVVQKRALSTSTALASMLVSWDEILSGLTPRQKKALLQAIERGYYDVPRRAGITEIVNGSGISRTTFGQHVQKAEGKLMHAIAPFLSLDLHAPD
jgi:predicted DNA binding protein